MSEQGVSPIGLNIARYRKAEGLSAADLAEKAGEGLTRSVIANLENGRKDDVTVKQLIALANALRVPPLTLIADLFHPGQRSAYLLPEITAPIFSVQNLRVEQATTGQRNIDLFNYLRGVSLLHDTSTGAGKLAAEMATAYNGHFAAWGRFASLAVRYAELLNGAEPEYSHEQFSFDITVLIAASEVLRWNEALTRLGVEVGALPKNLEQALRGLSLPTTIAEIDAYRALNDPQPPFFNG